MLPLLLHLAPVRAKKATSSGRWCSACLNALSQVGMWTTCPSNLGKLLTHCGGAMALGAWRCLLGVESPQVGDVVVVRWARI